jgi:hypothetical protein
VVNGQPEVLSTFKYIEEALKSKKWHLRVKQLPYL